MAVLGVASCTEERGEPRPPPKVCGWDERVVRLQTEGFDFAWNQRIDSESFGTGIWVGPEHILTMAHVLLRARVVRGVTEQGQTFGVDRVQAFDLDADLALVTVDHPPPNRKAEKLDWKPPAMGPFRDLKVLSVGNQLDGGLAVSRGRIIAVQEGRFWIHDALLAPGSSGGALFDVTSCRIIGLNKSLRPYRRAFAVPTWKAQYLRPKSSGTAPASLFGVKDQRALPTRSTWNGTECLDGQAILRFPVGTERSTDLLIEIGSEQPLGARLFIDHIPGTVEFEPTELISGSVVRAISVRATTPMEVRLKNPALDRVCFELSVSEVVWSKRL